MEKWQDPNTFLIWVIIIIFFMFFLLITLVTVFYLSYKKMLKSKEEEHIVRMLHQKDLLLVSLDTQEAERLRIASDLHDNIINLLTVIRLKNAMNFSQNEIDQMLETVINESRRISHELLPPMYEEKNVKDLLIEIVKNWKDYFQVNIYEDIRVEKIIKSELKILIIRVIQELLNNIYKHAENTEINFHLRITDSILAFMISDNGKGFQENENKGIGMKNISLRCENLGALYKFKSKPLLGTKFIFVLPLLD